MVGVSVVVVFALFVRSLSWSVGFYSLSCTASKIPESRTTPESLNRLQLTHRSGTPLDEA
jgi:hypothetical protein